MNIAYLVNQYPKVSHTFIRREILALEQQGCAVKRFSIRPCPDPVKDDDDKRELEKTRVILDAPRWQLLWDASRAIARHPQKALAALGTAWRLGGHSDRGRLRHLAYFAEAAALTTWLAKDRIDHLHAHFGTNSATVALLVEALGGPSYSFTVHGPEEFDKPEALGLPEKIQRARFVVAISHFGRGQLYRFSSADDWKKIHVIRCGVDNTFLKGPLSSPPEHRRLVSIGRLCEQKGQMLLVEAAAMLARKGLAFELVLVGDGPMRAQIEQAIEDNELKAHVRITGWMSSAEVRDEILEARALVLPSLAEGLPVVIMEALALGRPVISTYIAGIPELVVPGESGYLAYSGTAAPIAEAMEAVLNASPDELRRLGENGARRVRAQHHIDTEAEKLAQAFRNPIAPT